MPRELFARADLLDEQLRADLMLVITGRAFVGASPWVRSRDQFTARIDDGWNKVGPAVDEVCTLAESVLALGNQVDDGYRLGFF